MTFHHPRDASGNDMKGMKEQLALCGGPPVRSTRLPYGRQWITEEDVAAVVAVLRSDWLTTGPKVTELEEAFATTVGARHAVAVSSGTAALHGAVAALGLGVGDEVIVPTLTFAASANCLVYQGATPIFADVDPDTLLLSPTEAERLVTPRTRAILAVDYAGAPCDYHGLREVATRYGLNLLADGCHALGARRDDQPVGSLADLTAFSLHPVKHITAGEGGMVTTDNPLSAQHLRLFRNHGITTDHREREQRGEWQYQMVELGFNYRMTDIQSALALSQLHRLPDFLARRRAIAQRYHQAFADIPGLSPLTVPAGAEHAYHLYVVRLHLDYLSVDRNTVLRALRAEGIGANVHYWPVHLHPYYQRTYHTGTGRCPVAEAAAHRILSLPLFPLMTDSDVEDVISAVNKVLMAYAVY
ncbi:UDP-4-amino-4-deoxy-L-arabinose-oxoglutarate aminotransferase [Gammaproteobacteria bacterium]